MSKERKSDPSPAKSSKSSEGSRSKRAERASRGVESATAVSEQGEESEEVLDAAVGTTARQKPAQRTAVNPAEAIELDERKIRAPDTQTLVMLVVIAAATLIMWAGGRAACNLHPPRETRRPRQVKLEELARTPKDAALELSLRWGKKDFDGALQLSTGTLTARLKKSQQACQRDEAACNSQREALKDKVLGVAVVLSRSAASALVRVSTEGASEPKSPFRLTMKREGPLWKAEAFEPGAGSVQPAQPPTPKRPSPSGGP